MNESRCHIKPLLRCDLGERSSLEDSVVYTNVILGVQDESI